MFASLVSARSALDGFAREFDASMLSPEEARQVVDEFGAIRRVVDGMVAKAAKRIAETNTSARSPEASVARTLGVPTGEVRAAIETATRLERLATTEAAVRDGRLSARAAQMIAEAATVNPDAERELLDMAERGLVPLKDACIAARAQVEEPGERAKRQRSQQYLRMWTDTDGMIAGKFRYAPEIGGPLKSAIEAQQQRIFRARRRRTEHESHDAYAAEALAGPRAR